VLKKFLNFTFGLFIICSLVNAKAAFSVVGGVEIVGNERIETATILSNIKIHPGETVSQDQLDEAVRKLFETGYFSDVKISLKGNNVIIAVVENPIVNQLAFEGNKEIDDKLLREQIKLKPRQVYTLTKLNSDTKIIYDLYRLKGYFGATVTPKIIRRDQNRVDVIFEVNEGESTKVQQIVFVGNKMFSSSKLETILQTKETRWYRFFSTDDNYDADRMAYDQELLRVFYLENGYADFRVKSAVAELTPDQKEFFITFTLEEGERYKFGKLKINSKIPKVEPAELYNLLTIHEGDWYSSKAVEKTISAMTETIGNAGYAFVDVHPKIDRSVENHIISINFEITEGPRVYIDRILISGNYRTDEDVIRRELLLFEGDAFNAHKLKQSERHIKNLGFFKKVAIKQEPSDAPDKVNLIIDLEEEESTGEFSVSGGYSTSDGILGDIGVRERNFLGRGQDVHANFTLSKRRRQFDVGFTEPYFLDRPLAAGIDFFNSRTAKHFGSSFEHQRTGTNLRLGYHLTENLSQTVAYTIRTDRISGVRNSASRFIREQAGSATTSMVSQGLLYDRRDSIMDPTEGYYMSIQNQFAGVGGDVRYLKNDVNGGYYVPITEGWVLGLGATGGIMHGLGKKVRIVDRYDLGGDGSLRGFRVNGVGPRDKATRDSLGGFNYYTSTAELLFPLGLPNEFGIKGSVFTEAGSLWGTKEPRNEVLDKSSIRASVGAGISWRSPIGPIRIDIAKAVKKEKFDSTRTIHFGFGTRF
jgi:outer membrane protein insertion porin family